MPKAPQQYGFFAMIDRMRLIKRWSLMHNFQSENLSEHSLMVAVIAHCLGMIRNLNLTGKALPRIDANALAVQAMFHDFTETLTGDLPTPIKYYDAALRSAYQAVEQAAEQRLLQFLPEALRAVYAPFIQHETVSADELQLIKAADTIAAYLKCCQEVHAGNCEFKQAKDQTAQKLKQLACVEADYFLAHFAAGFEMSLDELNPTLSANEKELKNEL